MSGRRPPALSVAVALATLGAAASSPAASQLRVQTVKLHASPIALTFAYQHLWAAAETASGETVVLRLDDSRDAPPPTRVAFVGTSGPDIGAVAAGDGFVWAAAGTHLARIATDAPYRTRRISLPGVATAVAVGAGYVWLTTVGPQDLLLRLDPHTLRTTRRLRLRSPVRRLVYGLGWLWTDDQRGLARIAARTGRRTPIGLIGAPPSDLAVADDRAWAFSGAGIAALTSTGSEQWNARLPVRGGSLAVGGTVAWTTDDCGCRRGTLVAYDVRRRHLLARVSTGTTPVAIAATGDGAWVADFGSASLTEVRR